MAKIELGPVESAFIADRIRAFEQEVPEPAWLVASVIAHQALPIYVDWTEACALRPDGNLVRWSTDGQWVGVRDLDDPVKVNLTLAQGLLRYPELKALRPAKPSGATICTACGGTGTILDLPEAFKHLICECGGVGWLPPKTP